MTLAKVLQGGIICRKGEEWKAGAMQYFVLYNLFSFFICSWFSPEPRPRMGNVMLVFVVWWVFFPFLLLLCVSILLPFSIQVTERRNGSGGPGGS